MRNHKHQILKELLKKIGSGKYINSNEGSGIEQVIFNNYLLDNQFVSIFNLLENEFVLVKDEVEKVLFYEAKEFDFKKLLQIIPPLELFLTLEYGLIALEIMTSNQNFQTLCQTYWVSFPLFKKGESKLSQVSIKRQIFHLEKEEPVSVLDVWEDISFRSSNNFVKWALFSPVKKESLELNKKFFQMWRKKLGISFSPRELQVLVLGEKGLSAKEIANVIGVKKGRVEERFKNMKRKTKRVIEKLNTDIHFTKGIKFDIEVPHSITQKELLQHAYTFGLLPNNILKEELKLPLFLGGEPK